MTIYTEWGDEIWCEDQYVAMNTLQDGTVTGTKTKGSVRIAAGQRVTVKNVTFENNRCDGNLSDLWEGDGGGAIR